jgi:leucine dehydrogenase
MPVFEHSDFSGHERVVHITNGSVGLRAIIAIHDRTLGPAVGGCRLYPYASEADALADVLRLSKGMTYKNALAGLPFGGGKSVIIADPSAKTPELLRAFAGAVDALDGAYWTGEDINIGPGDVEAMAAVTPYLLGRTQGDAHSGDPSPFTAGGCFAGIKAALAHVHGSSDVAGRRVAIQGLGNVGFALARQVAEAGGSLVVADVRADLAERAAAELGAEVVAPDAIYQQDCDVFAPCALGGTLNRDTVPRLRARIVCGSANNQLASPEIGRLLLERGIAYAPDFIVNAGGILNASGDFFGQYDPAEVGRKIAALGDTTLEVLERSALENRPTHEIADEMAEAVLVAARQSRAG